MTAYMKLLPLLILLFYVSNCFFEKDSEIVTTKAQFKSIYTRTFKAEIVKNTLQFRYPSRDLYLEYYADGKLAEYNMFSTDDGCEVRFRYYYDFDKLIKKESYRSDSSLYRKYYYEYDVNKRLIKTSIFEANGSPYMSIYFVNDSAGNDIKEIKIDSYGDTLFIYDSKYDSLSNLVEKKFYGLKNDYYRKELYRYDSKSNQIEKLWYSEEDKMTYRFVYEYDSANRLVVERDYPQDNLFDTSIFYQQTTYEYDDFNNTVKEVQFRPEEKTKFTQTCKYEYDDSTNWIKRTTSYLPGETKYISIREIEYYD